jgi:hypothetical protein
MMFSRLAAAIGCASFLAMLTGCDHSASNPAKQSMPAGDTAVVLKRLYPDGPMLGKGSARINYVSNAHVIEKDAGLEGLLGESTDGHGLVFSAETPQIANLKEGDILVIKGVAARKVLGVDRRGGQILVVNDVVGLRDVVQDGEIHLETPIKFGHSHSAQLERPPFTPSIFDLLATPAYAQDSFSPENNAAAQASSNGQTGATIDSFGNAATGLGKFIVGGWTITNWTATAVGDRLNINLAITRTSGLGGFKALITMNGFISNFDLISNMKLGSSFATTQLTAAVKTMAGQMKFAWEIGKDTPGGFAKEDRIKLPGALTIPLSQYVAGLPLQLQISSAIIIHPAITGGQQYAAGAFTVTYNGAMIDTANNQSSQTAGDLTASATLDQDKGISAVAPIGMLVAFCAPRFELSLGYAKLLEPPSAIALAAGKVDSWIGAFAKSHPTVGNILNATPIGTAVITNSLKSNAAVWAQLISTEGVTESGSSVIIPCSNATVQVAGQIGFDANLFNKDIVGNGKPSAEHGTDVFNKSWNKNTGGVCAGIGK